MWFKTRYGLLVMNRMFRSGRDAENAGFKFWFSERGRDFYIKRYRDKNLTREKVNVRYNALIGCAETEE